MSNGFAKLDYIDPKRGVWMSLFRSVVHGIAATDKNTRARRPESKAELEYRQAALFALARSVVGNDSTVRFAMVPTTDDSADTVLRTGADSHHYEPVQLKEVVPEAVDARQTLEALLADIARKYCTDEVLTIAIHLNRDLVTTFGTITDPALSGVTFYLFGLCDTNRGFLAKDPFGPIRSHRVRHSEGALVDQPMVKRPEAPVLRFIQETAFDHLREFTRLAVSEPTKLLASRRTGEGSPSGCDRVPAIQVRSRSC